MKVTKYVHACLLAETDTQTILIDSGQFSWESGLFDVEKLEKLDAVVITHEHFDHFHLPFVEAIAQKFPEVRFISTSPVVGKLQEMGIANSSQESVLAVEIFSRKPHAALAPLGDAPENIAVHIAGKLTVGGDRHDLEESREVLALTVTAPWGSMTDAAAMALDEIAPKVIIPVHDWHWSDTARKGAYDRLEELFAGHDIKFVKTVDGQTFEV